MYLAEVSLELDYPSTITIVQGCLILFCTLYLDARKTRLDKNIFKRELFESVNARYSVLNGKLQALSKKPSVEGTEINLDGAYDYLNLCAEEYYWYKKGLVDSEVWECWYQGMLSWYSELAILQKLVEFEQQKKTKYYNEEFLTIFTRNLPRCSSPRL